MYPTDAETLKDCPFCGERAEIRNILGRDSIVCSNCHCMMTGTYVELDTLIEEWNTRACDNEKTYDILSCMQKQINDIHDVLSIMSQRSLIK